jgi:hypothetical protein
LDGAENTVDHPLGWDSCFDLDGLLFEKVKNTLNLLVNLLAINLE